MTASGSTPLTRCARPALLLALTLCIAASHPVGARASEDSQVPQDSEQEQSYALQQSSSPVTDASPDELQQLVESTAREYSQAVAHREDVQAQLDDAQARIQELDEQLPGQRDAAALAMQSSYKYQSGANSLALLLSADDFEEFVSMLHALNAVQQDGTEQIQALLDAQSELQSLQDGLQAQLDEAARAEQDAGDALERAKEARAQAVAAQEAALEAQRQAIAAAAAQAQQSAAAGDPATQGADAAGDGTDAQVPAADAGAVSPDAGASQEDAAPPATDDTVSDGSGDVSLASDRDVFIAQWGPRIDAYLAGSAMTGQGPVFAAAAWDYGIDPRISPAIATVESGLGSYCFLPYNAWGWGSYSWGGWSDAIYGHVGGFSRGYGSTLDYDDALSYCPSNPDSWYNSVLSQMAQI